MNARNIFMNKLIIDVLMNFALKALVKAFYAFPVFYLLGFLSFLDFHLDSKASS